MHTLLGIYTAALDELIGRSKVVLDKGFYKHGGLEMIRVFDLFANARTVVSKVIPDEVVDDELKEALVAVP